MIDKNENNILIIIVILIISIMFSCNSNIQRKHKIDFNAKEFQPDTTYVKIFSWKDVQQSLQDRLDSKIYKDNKSCPKCGLKSDKLVWINFCTPADTWKNLCGRAGSLSICPLCKIQVEFIPEITN